MLKSPKTNTLADRENLIYFTLEYQIIGGKGGGGVGNLIIGGGGGIMEGGYTNLHFGL